MFSIMSTIASTRTRGEGAGLTAHSARTGEALAYDYRASSDGQIGQALRDAAAAFAPYRATSPDQRAAFLEAIAVRIDELDDDFIARAVIETGLAEARIRGERTRTTNQLRLFAALLREGSWLGVRIDPAEPHRRPAPRADIRRQFVPVGPVAVFGASNFPLAFSTAGGDTASALAAGCPVIVKAHQGHPATAAAIGGAIGDAVHQLGLAGGVFSQVFGPGHEIGHRLVAAPQIKAVGFTGSRTGGLALLATAQARPEPIPVYAEMSSINPVIILPGALVADAEGLAQGYVGSLTLGSGQFCTNPGVLAVPRGADGDRFVAAVAAAIGDAAGQTMLSPGILQSYRDGVDAMRESPRAQLVAEGRADAGANAPAPAVFAVDVADYGGELAEEVFGAAGVICRFDDAATEVPALLRGMEGQLTGTMWVADSDHDLARSILPAFEEKVGRLLLNGWPTGVEPGDAMVHGGPFPATSDQRSTSVGTGAIDRFLRPVAYQDVPDALLPPALQSGNPWGVPRRVDGRIELPDGYNG